MSKDEKIVFCTGGGCTAKLGAGVLSRILEKLPRGEQDPNLLVGYDSRDDAAVYQVTENLALVQTVDFFPPMVDDPLPDPGPAGPLAGLRTGRAQGSRNPRVWRCAEPGRYAGTHTAWEAVTQDFVGTRSGARRPDPF